MHRALRRAQRIRRRLGGSANMMEPFPEKPKGMHWQTYDRLFCEHHEAEMEQLAGMKEWLDKIERQLS
jgi:DNA-binding ferritin-like protein